MTVRPVRAGDAAHWLRLRVGVYPGSAEEHRDEIETWLQALDDPSTQPPLDPALVLLAIDDEGTPVGLAEASIRSHAEGCRPGRILYLEGIYVEEEGRRRGVARTLVEAVEEWGRSRGCTEMASDTTPDNVGSQAFHRSLGFQVADRIICYRKDL